MTNVVDGRFISIPLEDRYWAKVDKRGPDECWPWTGATDGRRYGIISQNGRNRKATHVAVEFATGEPFPAKKMACHTCDNPPCVNPAHLFVGTMQDNMRDAFAKGRINLAAFLGNNHNRAKTHCVRGHPLSGDNLIRKKKGHRGCRACQKARPSFVVVPRRVCPFQLLGSTRMDAR